MAEQPSGDVTSDAGERRVPRVLVRAAVAAALLSLVAITAHAVVGGPASEPEPDPATFHEFGEVTLDADFVVTGAGRNVDSIAFWEAPEAADSLMFVTSKNLALVEVWRHPYDAPSAEAEALRHPCLEATGRSATNGVVVDQEQDLLYVAASYSPNVCVFSLPGLEHQRTFTSGVAYGREPNLALLRLPDGAAQLYVSDDDRVFVHDPAGELLSTFTPVTGLEAMWADSHAQVLYIPDEDDKTGVHAYRPDGTPYVEDGTSVLGAEVFSADAEGITAYTCPATGDGDDGSGLLVVSDQVDEATGNEYEVFDRETWAHLGTLRLRLPDGAGLVRNTDGVASTQQSSAEHPGGLLAALHDDQSVAGVAWEKVLEAVSTGTGEPFGCGG